MKYSEIPWRQMIGVRNILIHEYFGIDNSIIWEIIKKNLSDVKPIIMKAIQEHDS
ncbi:HepT-like ribonuclease domain-containing protein [Cohnella sp. 56]|uniref:HepT-like ribonuclease domain-containing protein n=1 Tax=Cohnella sp. 56 TaxID=3113722 RepID=UPI0030E8E619